MVATDLAVGAHFGGQAEEPLPKVEIVRALIQQDSPALSGPGGTPTARGIIGGGAEPIRDNPIDTTDFSELAGLDQFAELDVIRIGPLVEHGGEDLLFRAMRGDETLAIRLVDGDRFLHQHVKPGAQGLDTDGGVGIVRRGNKDAVHLPGMDEIAGARETGGFLETGQRFLLRITNCGKAAAGNFSALNGAGVGPTHTTETDDAEAKFFHRGAQKRKSRRRMKSLRIRSHHPSASNEIPGRSTLRARNGKKFIF